MTGPQHDESGDPDPQGHILSTVISPFFRTISPVTRLWPAGCRHRDGAVTGVWRLCDMYRIHNLPQRPSRRIGRQLPGCPRSGAKWTAHTSEGHLSPLSRPILERSLTDGLCSSTAGDCE